MYIGLLSILLLCLQFGFTQEVSVFNNSNEYMEHLDLVSNTFLKKKKKIWSCWVRDYTEWA